MEFLAQLWLPILVSAIVVFFASFLAWMVSQHHKADVQKLPDEQAMRDYLGQAAIPPGTYMWPNCATSEEMKSDAFKAQMDAGPWGSINIVAAKPNFARNLYLTFLFYVILSTFVAYIAWQAHIPGAGFLTVFQVTGATAVLGYCAGAIPNAIFFSKPTRFILTEFADGFVYGLLTGIVFGLLWPGA